MEKNKNIIISLALAGVIACLPIYFANFTENSALGQIDDENEEVKQLNKEIQEKKDQIKKMQERQEEYTRAIQEKQQEKATLNNELSILDNRIAKFELDIESTETEIGRINLEIRKTSAQIDGKIADIEKEKSQIAIALKLIYKQDRASGLEIILLNNSFSEFLNQARYLEDVNREIKMSLDSLKRYRDELEKERTILGEKNIEAVKLKAALIDQKKTIEAEKENKAYVLDQTNSSERQFQRLLSQAKQEQLNAASEITNIEKLVREKISKLSADRLEFNDNGLIWPVTKNVITAYFHDPEYPFRYVFEHPAIDIRSPQASTLKTAASGYVAKVKNGGARGYSYIMIIHGDGLATVYGHVFKSFVNEDEYVTQGQVIGLTGGLPGTNGAGGLTTGPHLHFEVRLNGIPVDPLNYLP